MPKHFYGKPLEFNAGSHRYFWDGQPLRSVTTILGVIAKPALIQWAANMAVDNIKSECLEVDGGWFVGEVELERARKAHAQKRDAAGDAGSLVHQYAESVLNGSPMQIPADEQVVRGCMAFERFMAEHKLEPKEDGIERRIMSKRHMYAGTTDFFGHVDGRLGILDFKTSSGVWDEFWLQTAGYEVALTEELFDGDAEHLWRFLVHLDKTTGEYKLYAREFDAGHRDAWLSCVALDRAMQTLRKESDMLKRSEKAVA